MTRTEKRYAQIEKEALAATWACERFSSYLLGKRFTLETDHKPLVPLPGTKKLDALPPRVLRFCLRLTRFDHDVKHVPGKLLTTADTLSRAPLSTTCDSIQEEVEVFVNNILANFPASCQTLEKYKDA